jgi:hypothetical protein
MYPDDLCPECGADPVAEICFCLIDAENAPPDPCPGCGGSEWEWMGTLDERTRYRCRGCGADVSRVIGG